MGGHKYTEEEQSFLTEYVPGHSYKEIAEAFSLKFGWEISLGQIKGRISRYKLSTGRTGRYQKGNVPYNKGIKGIYHKGCEKGWFKKGNRPANYRSVGSERINVDGYIEVKVADPNIWKAKHIVVWESVHGKIPKGYIITFRDNNRTNVDIGNLLLVKRSTHAVLNQTGLCKYSGEFKETAINIAKLKQASSDAMKRKNK